ncbi:hypothetical protein DPMN_148458 [Dreissena polymorpha]|uniref:Uncharacterized protein n=1 Tax=Dreissena polymorpha TaxID=45954 RepID=A0A9D4FA11_DREPO|nr:hypothetical protein DPMN_148458 [Dreissena polymorpha]
MLGSLSDTSVSSFIAKLRHMAAPPVSDPRRSAPLIPETTSSGGTATFEACSAH